MSSSQAVRLAKARQQIETELVVEVELRHEEYKFATEEDRIAYRNRFALALLAFNNLVLDGKLPVELEPFNP